MPSKFWEFYRKINKLPKNVRIEACSICQLNCRDCYMRKNDPNIIIGNGYLKFEDYKNFIKKNPYIKNVELSLAGEIFLNPDLHKIIKYSYEKNINLTALNGVNFNNVSDEILEALVKYEFKGMTFSIDAVTNEIYQIYRQGGNLNNVIKNIEKLNFYKEKYKSIYPILQMQYIIFIHNTSEIKYVKEFAEKLKIENIYFKEPWNGEIKFKDLDQQTLFKIHTIHRQYKQYNILNNNIPLCHQPFIQPQINWNGELLGCCCSTNKTLSYNVFKTSLQKALKSKKMKYIQNVLQGKITPDDSIACGGCYFYKIMKNNNKYLTPKQIKFI